MRLLTKMCNVNFILGTLSNTADLCFCCVCVGCVGQATGCWKSNSQKFVYFMNPGLSLL